MGCPAGSGAARFKAAAPSICRLWFGESDKGNFICLIPARPKQIEWTQTRLKLAMMITVRYDPNDLTKVGIEHAGV